MQIVIQICASADHVRRVPSDPNTVLVYARLTHTAAGVSTLTSLANKLADLPRQSYPGDITRSKAVLLLLLTSVIDWLAGCLFYDHLQPTKVQLVSQGSPKVGSRKDPLSGIQGQDDLMIFQTCSKTRETAKWLKRLCATRCMATQSMPHHWPEPVSAGISGDPCGSGLVSAHVKLVRLMYAKNRARGLAGISTVYVITSHHRPRG